MATDPIDCPDHIGDEYDSECDACQAWSDAEGRYWQRHFELHPTQAGPHILSESARLELEAIERARE